MMLRIQLHKCVVITATLLSFLYADVTVSVASGGKSTTIKNETSSAWRLGGVRYNNGGYNWTAIDGYDLSWFAINNTPDGTENEVELYFKSNAPSNDRAKLNATEKRSFIHKWNNITTGTAPIPGSEFLLLKTGASGIPDDPVDEDPITIDQLDSLSKLPEFYDESYRPDTYDSLGAKGGLYSGGFLDTWLGETQAQIAKPIANFEPNEMTFTNFSTKNAHMYYMALAMGQEFFHVDLQWMAGFGAKETLAGTPLFRYDAMGQDGVYGPWQVQNETGVDRALPYAQYFPKYELKLSSAKDVTSSGINMDEMMSYYCRDDNNMTPHTSATTVNAFLFSTFVHYANYDVFAYATDICWKEALEISRNEGDPYLGMSAMACVYNLGNSNVTHVEGLLNPTVVDVSARDPKGRDLFPTGNGAYQKYIYPVFDALTEASRLSLTDNSVEIFDFNISKDELFDFYFGDNGTVGQQGKGGLLRHYYEDSEISKRQLIWDRLTAAFNLLKGRAPSTSGTESVSFRYDFLGILRTTKDLIPFKRTFRVAGDASKWVPLYSTGKKGVCPDSPPLDEKYPYIKHTSKYDPVSEDYVVLATVEDNIEASEVKWTLDYNWKDLHWRTVNVAESGTGKKKTFKITIPKADVEFFRAFPDGKSGHYVWFYGSDGSGNSTVTKLPVPYKNPTLLDSAAAFDTDGDGIADQVKAYVQPGELKNLKDYKEVRYSWPTATNDIIAANGDSRVDASDDTIIVSDKTNLAGGFGLGAFTYAIDTLYTIYDPATQVSDTGVLGPVEIADKVGPAISAASILMEDSRVKDTLILTVTEVLEKIDKTDHLYLQFKKGSTINDIKAESFKKINDFEYKAFFDKSELENEDSVRFAFASDPVEDVVGNKPADYNQWVKINFKGGKEPEFKDAYMLDIDGDGDGDSIRVELTLGGAVDKYTVADISSGKFSWPGNSLSDNLDTITKLDQSDNAFSFKHVTTTGIGTGRIEIEFPGDYKVAGDIADSVGPAIVNAVLSIQDENRDKDTLWLTVTEELKNIDETDHKYLKLKAGSSESEEESYGVEQVSPTVYKFTFDKGFVASKDSVKFVHSGSVVEDLKGNKPKDINQRVEILIVGGKEPKLNSANMYDTDGDGRGDSIRVELKLGSSKEKYTSESITGGNYSWPGLAMDQELDTINKSNESEDAFSFTYETDGSAGDGRIIMNFPEDYVLSGDIKDKVGPVIDSAVCLQQDIDRDKDSLLLETSEVLKENFSDDTKYIVLFEDSSDTKGDTIEVEKTKLSNNWYQMIIPKNAVVYGDWVQFVYNSGIEDGVGNRPLNINKKVKINVKGDVAPNISKAEIYDIKGTGLLDGDGDSIYVELELSDDPKALTVDSLKEVEYTWNGTTNTKSRGDLERISSSKFAIVDESMSGGSGTGTIKLIFENDKFVVEDKINDKVAPVIKSAKYYNWKSEKDTLIVTFSEELKEDGSEYPFMFKSGKTLKVRSQDVKGSVVTYSIEDGDALERGDSIWITGNEDIEDKADNEQKSNDNVHVLIDYKRVTTVTEARYYDTDSRPDGFIDEIVITFDADLDSDDEDKLKETFVLPSERFMTVEDVSIKDDKVTLYVSQKTSEAELNTAVEDYDKLSVPFTEGGDSLCYISDGDVDIKDRLAPVIASARFYPVTDKKDGKLIDTLFITYSEEVEKTNRDEPFMFSDGSDNDTEYTFEVDGGVEGKVSVPYAAEYKGSNVLPGAGDSVWIDDDGRIKDTKGNTQERNSTPVELIVGKYPRSFDVWITPTPYDMNEYENDSMVTIRVVSDTRKLPDNISAQAVIYDKVGNVIKKISASEFGDVEDEILSYSFLPKNKNNRRLGEGAYAVKVFLETEGSDPLPYERILYIKGIVPGKEEKKDSDKEDE